MVILYRSGINFLKYVFFPPNIFGLRIWNPRIRVEPKPLWLGRGTRGRPVGCGAGAASTLQDARLTVSRAPGQLFLP